jgi:poly(beta-D-mannuronate) lyase
VAKFVPNCLLVIFILALGHSSAHAKTIDVRNMSELEAAIKAAQPGDTIQMASGEWRDAVINFNASANEKLPTTLKASVPGQVALTGKSKLRLNAPYLVVDGLIFRDGASSEGEPVIDFRSHHCRVTNTAIINFNPADTNVRYHWVYFTGSDNRLDQTLLEGKNNRNPVVANGCCESRRNKVDLCYFKDIAFVPENGREIIQVQGVGRSDQYTQDGAFFTIESNLFERADGEGAEIISIKSNHNSIRFNTIRESRGGITLRSGYANTVEGNYIFGRGKSGTSGIRVQGPRQRVINNYIEGVVNGLLLHTGEELFTRGCETDYLTVDFVPLKRPEAPCGYVVRYGQVRDGLFAHNTFVNLSGVDIYVGTNYKGGWPQQQMVRIPESNVFANNLIYKPSGGPAITTQIADTKPPFNKLKFKPNQFLLNLVFGGELVIAESAVSLGFITKDPLLINVDGMFRPAPRSPVRDAGVPIPREFPGVFEDIGGKRRVRPDIGADEMSNDRLRRGPLTPADVGPSWMRTK